MKIKILPMLVIAVATGVFGAMALVPGVSYGSAASDGAASGAAAGAAAAEANAPAEEPEEESGGSCG